MTKVMEEVHLTTIKPKNKVLLLAQEISFAKVLACNDKRLRDRGVKRLKKWFMARSQGSHELTKEDLLRIWKGLFYCMWMSDKPLIQEELAEEISSLVHSFANFKTSLLFVEVFFSSMSIEWFGIDQLRMDKFMMLVRRLLRQSLELVARLKWRKVYVQKLADVYEKTLISAPMGLSMHFIEIFCEELAKVGKGELSNETVMQFIIPFARIMADLKDGRLISHITRHIFLNLIRQTELGIEHEMKFSLWKEYGFPGGNLDAAEKIETDDELTMEDDDSEEDREVGPDARAGKVDVLLPPLEFNASDLLKTLVELRNKKETTTKARKTLIQLITKFEKLAAGKYPLGLHRVELVEKQDKKKEIEKVAKQLIIDEQKMIYSDIETEETSSTDDATTGECEDKTTVRKEGSRKQNNKKKRTGVWEVSDSDSNISRNESVPKCSVNISETVKKDKITPNKRKNMEESTPVTQRSVKKIKVSPLTVNDSKENSFSSPVSSTPKNKNRNNVLKKLPDSSNNSVSVVTAAKNVPDKKKSSSPKNRSKGKTKKNNSTINTSNDLPKIENELVGKQSNKLLDDSSASCKKNDKGNSNDSIQLNTTQNYNGWGTEWDDPSQDIEYEIFIPNKKYVEKRKTNGLPYPVSSFIQKAVDKITPKNKLKRNRTNKTITPSSQKKVEFNLSANCSQEYKDYTRKLRSKDAVIFDAAKKPVQGLLKNSTPSPINPFYRNKLKLNFLTPQ